jgi:hypothetical protein
LGLLADLREDKSLQGVGIGAMLKVKDRALIGLNLKTGQSVNYGFGFYLKL